MKCPTGASTAGEIGNPVRQEEDRRQKGSELARPVARLLINKLIDRQIVSDLLESE